MKDENQEYEKQSLGGMKRSTAQQAMLQPADYQVLDQFNNPTKYPCAKIVLDHFFIQWLQERETEEFVHQLIEDSKHGNQLQQTNELFRASRSQYYQSTSSPRVQKDSEASHSSKQKDSKAQVVKPFYRKAGPQVSIQEQESAQLKINEIFSSCSNQTANVEQTWQLVQQVLGLPGVLSYPLVDKLQVQNSQTVTRQAFQEWLYGSNILGMNPCQRLFEVLKKPQNDYIEYDDLGKLLSGVLQTHAGLDFLRNSPEFQERYAETVIFRIFYTLSRLGNGRITYRELRRSDFLDVLKLIDVEDDINKVYKYFSYKHFYVIYCKFWELDGDHDMMLGPQDLERYGQGALSKLTIERIFQEAPRKLSCSTPGCMSYQDFVWFILSEEDKSTDPAIEYWFRCLDLDGDGLVTVHEMQYFYEEQFLKLQQYCEAVLFEDIVCQLHDMIQPAREGCFSLADLKRCRVHAPVMFNMLCNLHKFIQFETRDPFSARQEREQSGLTDWDRYAYLEYVRLALEDEQSNNDNGQQLQYGDQDGGGHWAGDTYDNGAQVGHDVDYVMDTGSSSSAGNGDRGIEDDLALAQNGSTDSYQQQTQQMDSDQQNYQEDGHHSSGNNDDDQQHMQVSRSPDNTNPNDSQFDQQRLQKNYGIIGSPHGLFSHSGSTTVGVERSQTQQDICSNAVSCDEQSSELHGNICAMETSVSELNGGMDQHVLADGVDHMLFEPMECEDARPLGASQQTSSFVQYNDQQQQSVSTQHSEPGIVVGEDTSACTQSVESGQSLGRLLQPFDASVAGEVLLQQ